MVVMSGVDVVSHRQIILEHHLYYMVVHVRIFIVDAMPAESMSRSIIHSLECPQSVRCCVGDSRIPLFWLCG